MRCYSMQTPPRAETHLARSCAQRPQREVEDTRPAALQILFGARRRYRQLAADDRADEDGIPLRLGQGERPVVAAVLENADERALPVGVQALPRLPITLGGADFVRIDDRQMHPQLRVARQD